MRIRGWRCQKIDVPVEIYVRGDLSGPAKAVYIYLYAWFSDGNVRRPWPGERQIAAATGFDEPTVECSVAELIAKEVGFRRPDWGLRRFRERTPPVLVVCSECYNPRLAHRVCVSCGAYRAVGQADAPTKVRLQVPPDWKLRCFSHQPWWARRVTAVE